MKRLRALLITALIIVLGTSTAFADIVSIPRMVYNAKWYIVAAIVVLIIVISLLRSAIRRRSEKNEAEISFALLHQYLQGGGRADTGEYRSLKKRFNRHIGRLLRMTKETVRTSLTSRPSSP